MLKACVWAFWANNDLISSSWTANVFASIVRFKSKFIKLFVNCVLSSFQLGYEICLCKGLFAYHGKLIHNFIQNLSLPVHDTDRFLENPFNFSLKPGRWYLEKFLVEFSRDNQRVPGYFITLAFLSVSVVPRDSLKLVRHSWPKAAISIIGKFWSANRIFMIRKNSFARLSR